MSALRSALFVAVVLPQAACVLSRAPEPEITRVQPDVASAGSSISILGLHFLTDEHVDFDNHSGSTALDHASVFLVRGNVTIALPDAHRLSDERIEATLPLELLPGTFGIRVIDPRGRIVELDPALRIGLPLDGPITLPSPSPTPPLVCSTTSGSVVLAASADTTLQEASGTPNGSDTALKVGNGSGIRHRAAVAFDVSGIPAGAVASRAIIELGLFSVSAGTAITVHRLERNWDESTALWDFPWAAAGGDIDATVLDSRVPAAADTTLSFDVTGAATAWLSGASANDGLLLRTAESAPEKQTKFDSRETSSPPLLHLDWCIPEGG